MRRSLASSAAALLVLAIAAPVPARSVEAAAEVTRGGTADGWLEVARERTNLRHAYVRGESGDGASGDLVVLIADRPLPEVALEAGDLREALARGDEARGLVAVLPEGGGEIEVYFRHPRLPAGISLRGLARFARESATAERLEGRLVLDDPGTAFEAWFSAPIERRDRSERTAAEGSTMDPPKPLDEAIRSGGEEEFEAALAAHLEAAGGLDSVLGSAMTPLVVAADAGNLYATRRLLESGAGVDFRIDRASFTPLMSAAGKESGAVLEALLIAGANVKLRSSSGFTALMHAVVEGRLDNARRLIAAGAEVARDREILLRLAREKGNAEMVALLESAPTPAP